MQIIRKVEIYSCQLRMYMYVCICKLQVYLTVCPFLRHRNRSSHRSVASNLSICRYKSNMIYNDKVSLSYSNDIIQYSIIWYSIQYLAYKWCLLYGILGIHM